MAAPFFTVVMATFARGRHIRPSVASVLRQTFDDFELIVVGDGSGEGIADVLGALPPERTRWFALPQNSGGQSAPNNRGIAEARGKWIAYLGHDDIWAAGHLAALAALARSGEAPDVAVSQCLFHGPPETGVLFATGVFHHERAPFQYFVPPSSFAHRREALAEIGGWRDPTKIGPPADADVLLRLAQAGQRFAFTGQVTVQKFAAGHRYLSYLDVGSAEQEAMLADPRLDDPSAWAATAAATRTDGRAELARYPDYARAAPGVFYAMNRANKGLARLRVRPLAGRTVLTQGDEPRALDWFPLERTASGVGYRWSGPNHRPRILIPFTSAGRARVTLRVLGTAGDLRHVTVRHGSALLPTEIGPLDGAHGLACTVTLDAARETVLELHTPAMRPPVSHPTPDPRSLGIAVAEILVEPLDAAGPPATSQDLA